HDWPLVYRGLQTSLFVRSLGIELTHFLHPKLPAVIRIGEQDSGRAVPSPPDDRVRWQRWFWVIRASHPAASGAKSRVCVPDGYNRGPRFQFRIPNLSTDLEASRE